MIEEIIKRLSPGIVFAIAVGSGLLWALAHYTAAPGSQISILWGLVEYQKVPRVDDEAPPRSGAIQIATEGADALTDPERSFPLNSSTKSDVPSTREQCDEVVDQDKVVLLNFSPQQYLERLDSNPSLNRQALFEDQYLGKWLSLRGEALSLTKYSDDDFLMMVAVPMPTSSVPEIFSVSLTSAEARKVSHFERGDVIQIQGRFAAPTHLDCGVLQ